MTQSPLIPLYGGELVTLTADAETAEAPSLAAFTLLKSRAIANSFGRGFGV